MYFFKAIFDWSQKRLLDSVLEIRPLGPHLFWVNVPYKIEILKWLENAWLSFDPLGFGLLGLRDPWASGSLGLGFLGLRGLWLLV